MHHEQLPLTLDDGLILRRAQADDVDQLVTFNSIIHANGPDEPALDVAAWTRDLMEGAHPSVGPEDFTVVVDPARQVEGRDKIVSSQVLLSQTWRYDGLAIGVGQPEIVGTDPEYRRRGLIRRQMEVHHSLSAARGELMQIITGIPYYYRQFGYEMTVDLSGSRAFFWNRPENVNTKPTRALSVRAATDADLPLLQELYACNTEASLLRVVRTPAYWRYRVFGMGKHAAFFRRFLIVETEDGAPFGYFACTKWKQHYVIDEISVADGCSLRDLALAAAQFLYAESSAAEETQPPTWLVWRLGAHHPVYTSLGRQLDRLEPPYAYFVRVPDPRAFLLHIAPLLERNLAGSVMAGFTGNLRLNLIRDHLRLNFEDGRLMEIDRYRPTHYADGDVMLPDLTLLHLLFRHRTIQELSANRRDCWAGSAQADVLLGALFPKATAYVTAFG